MDIDKGDIQWAISTLLMIWATLREPEKENSPQKRKQTKKQKRK